MAKPVISDRWSVISAWPDFVKVRTKCRRSLCNITLDCVIRLTEVWTLYTKVKWSVVPSLHRMKSQEHEYGDTSNSSVIHNTTYCWILKSFDIYILCVDELWLNHRIVTALSRRKSLALGGSSSLVSSVVNSPRSQLSVKPEIKSVTCCFIITAH